MHEKRYAILIDGDNISNKYIQIIMDEVSNDGVATYKRIYGDWTSDNLKSWKPLLLTHSVTPVQQYAYTSGKNATDSAMIIDAMDILYSKNVDGFCLVSSDSDFTRLAVRLRESGMHVIGMGESKTPAAFISSCDQFKSLDILLDKAKKASKATGVQDVLPMDKPETAIVPHTGWETIQSTVRSIVEEAPSDDGWMLLSTLGLRIRKRHPDFDMRNYGYSKLKELVTALGIFDFHATDGPGGVQAVSVKMKEEFSNPIDP